jgi:hypothetical protein
MNRRCMMLTLMAQQAGGVVSPWYLSGSIPAANCIIAYQSKGAADMAASLTNLANPGTYTAVPAAGLASPTFSAATGWTFDALSSTRITIGYVPPNQVTRSLIMRISDATAGNICGTRNTAAFLQITQAGVFFNGTGTAYTHSAALTTGVVAVAGLDAYLDGVDIGNITAGTYDQGARDIRIGCYNNNGSNSLYYTGKIQAWAIYDITLTALQVAAVTTAMQAL